MLLVHEVDSQMFRSTGCPSVDQMHFAVHAHFKKSCKKDVGQDSGEKGSGLNR